MSSPVTRMLLAAACALMGLAPHAAPPRASKPGHLPLSPRWKLAFEREGSVWVASGDGSRQRRVIANAEAPCWSPRRDRLAFVRQGNVWVAKADGGGQQPLTNRADWKKSAS